MTVQRPGELAQPDFARDPEPRIVCVENAIVVPVSPDLPPMPVQKSGVLDADGNCVTESLTWRTGGLVSRPPDPPDPASVTDLPGTHMFGGILFGHFGHFLVESTARLWALAQLEDEIDSVIFVPKFQRSVQRILEVQTPFLRLCGVRNRLVNTEVPLRVERLYVPQMGFGLGDMIEGTAAYRDFMRARFARDIAPEGGERLYISRSQLPRERGGLIGEERIEAWVAAEGYEIFHPQQHGFAEQIARYKAAREIISPDGSPLHMVALSGRPDLRVAIIPRRPDIVASVLARQLRAFGGIESVILDPPRRHWIPVKHGGPSRSSFGDIDVPLMGRQLAEAGFIADAGVWTDCGEALRSALIGELEKRQRTEFKLYTEPGS